MENIVRRYRRTETDSERPVTMSFSRAQSDGLMLVSGDFTLFTPRTVLSPESIQILTRYMSENLPANIATTQNVTFHGVHEINSPKEKLNCCFTFTDESKVEPGDIVAICPLGWKRFREIVFYVPAEIHSFDKWISMYTVSFEADNLPKDCAKYEFCYISSGNILGISKPFTFFSTSESDLSIISEGDYIAVEDPHDPGLVVFKSRGSKSTEDFSKCLDDGVSENYNDSSKVNDSYQEQLSQIVEINLSTNFENLHVGVENCSEQNELQHENNIAKSVNSASSAEADKNEIQEGQETKEISLEMSDSEDKAESTFKTENNTSDMTKVVNNETHKVYDDSHPLQSSQEQKDVFNKYLQSSTSSISTTCSNPHSTTTYCSSDMVCSNSSLPELINNSLSSLDSQLKTEESNNKNTFGAREVEDDSDNDAPHPESVEEINRSMGNSNIKTPIHSELSTNLIQQKVVSPSVPKPALTTEIKNDNSDHSSSSLSSIEVNNCVCSSSSEITAYKNKELQEKIKELEETNAFLKSRVSVLELELRTLNEEKYGILVRCIDSYENENSFLKNELDKRARAGCEIESLKFKCDKLTEENLELRRFITRCPAAFSAGGNKVLMLENNMLKAKCQQLEHKITGLHYAIQEEKSAQGLKSSRSVRQVILNQGHELAFMRSECREISEKLKTLIAMFESMNVKTEDYLTVTSSLSELQNKCALVIQRNQEKTKLFEPDTENREEKQKLLAQIESLRKEICDVQKQNLELKEQLISLRKQSVGKVSLQLLRK